MFLYLSEALFCFVVPWSSQRMYADLRSSRPVKRNKAREEKAQQSVEWQQLTELEKKIRIRKEKINDSSVMV